MNDGGVDGRSDGRKHVKTKKPTFANFFLLLLLSIEFNSMVESDRQTNIDRSRCHRLHGWVSIMLSIRKPSMNGMVLPFFPLSFLPWINFLSFMSRSRSTSRFAHNECIIQTVKETQTGREGEKGGKTKTSDYGEKIPQQLQYTVTV
mmetsp:Transcript_12636/g.24585  ORF Transcript_12636/g.24585 Transcript_12636/m.24585 type:complete len:147 (-) Transcript_12636:392-832(-)